MAGTVNVRELALDSLLEIEQGKRTLSEASRVTLGRYQYLSKQERSFYTRLVEGTTEYRLQLDYILDRVSKLPMKRCKPLIRNLLRLSLYQLRFLDGTPASAVCNEAVRLAKKRGFRDLSGYVNGVLRGYLRQQEQLRLPEPSESVSTLSVRYSAPEWLIERLLRWYGAETAEGILRAWLREAPLTVRVNRKAATVEQVKASLQNEHIRADAGIYTENTLRLTGVNYVGRMEAFRRGWITVQDESSVLQGYLVCPRPGDRILDICAAPGGKTLHAAERLWLAEQETDSGGGSVTARDVTEEKIDRIREAAERMGYPGIRIQRRNALDPDETESEQADILIADLPCSGLGVAGRKPDMKYRLTPEQLTELEVLQRAILQASIPALKTGGYLVYSTCTLNPAENEEQLRWLQERYPLRGIDLTGYLPERLIRETDGQPGCGVRAGYCTLLPGRQDCDGFFLALLQKETER